MANSVDKVRVDWRKPSLYSECTWHQLSPYIGRMKSTMARSLVEQYTAPGDTIYDPFCGAGTVALEGWLSGRHVIGADLNPYACVLTRAKLFPPSRLENALDRLHDLWGEAVRQKPTVDLRRVPSWVRRFFHPETLREVTALTGVLRRHHDSFLLSCMLGVLHHWRPGFLSYPACHTVPYLLDKRYPRDDYPESYEYREVLPRLAAKVRRAFARAGNADRQLLRVVRQSEASRAGDTLNGHHVSAIVTSPPYMNSLSYARDNRLRLWFLGVPDYRVLERKLSPRKSAFLDIMASLLPPWSATLPKNGPCVLVLGAVRREGRYHDLPEEVASLAENPKCGFRVTALCRNVIPNNRRARRSCRSTRQETILVLRKRG